MWALLSDIGDAGVSLYKVKAHLSSEDAEAGIIPWHDWRGNGATDRLVMREAMMAERKAPRRNGDSQLNEPPWIGANSATEHDRQPESHRTPLTPQVSSPRSRLG